MLNGLDLFSGIGGLSLALSPWVRPIAYCEIDRYCQSVLLSRMHDRRIASGPIWDDITTLLCELLPRDTIDAIYGGFPCQDISVAGHGVGLSGKRSGLYWDVYRLIKGLRPKLVYLENVPAIRTRGAIEISRSLAAIGYCQRWDIISAREVGASFLGERWFLVASPNSETLRIESWRSEWQNWKSSALNPPAGDIGLAAWSPKRGFEQGIFRAGNGIPFAVDRDRALGNAVVPLQARKAFQKLMGLNERQRIYKSN